MAGYLSTFSSPEENGIIGCFKKEAKNFFEWLEQGNECPG
jgi:hypothetical protein